MPKGDKYYYISNRLKDKYNIPDEFLTKKGRINKKKIRIVLKCITDEEDKKEFIKIYSINLSSTISNSRTNNIMTDTSIETIVTDRNNDSENTSDLSDEQVNDLLESESNKSEENTNDIVSEVKIFTENYKNILTIEKAKELGLHGGPGNGSGNRTKISKIYINTTVYGSSREPMTYPKCYNEIIVLDESQLNLLEEYKNKRIQNNLPCGQGVIGFIIHGENINERIKRPIRNDIIKHWKKFPCLLCGTKKTICDHKNDLYNDPRVLNTQTQTKEDFQPLCNNCNLRKRAVSLKTVKDKKRQPPPPNIRLLGIDFIKGDENYDPNDINAMVGTYWYDTEAFMNEVRNKLSIR